MASILDLVKHYQHAIEKYPNDEQKILKCIDKLFNLGVTVQHLQETGVGRTVNALRKEPGEVGQAARALVYKWKVMVAEESDHDEDHSQTTQCNGHENGRTPEDSDSDGRHKGNHYEYNKTNRNDENYSNSKHMNGNHNGGRRKCQSSEEEEPPVKKSRHTDVQDKKSNVHVKREQSETEHDSHSTSSEDSGSEDSESSREDRSREQKPKTELIDKHRSSSTKHSLHSSQEKVKKQESHLERHSKQSHSESRHTSEKSSKQKSSSDKHKKDKESSSSHKEKLENKSSDKEKKRSESKEDSSSKHRSSSDKHKSSSNSEKSKSHSEKSSSKSETHSSSHKHKSEKEKHKHSSEKSGEKHKSREHSSSKDNHSSSGREKVKDKSSSSSKDKENSHKSDKKHKSLSETNGKEIVSTSKSEKSDTKKSSKEKKSHSSSSHSSKSSKSSSSKSKDTPKKKTQKDNSEDSEDGIDCGSGASFAEALGMISPSKPKKKSSSVKESSYSPNNSGSDDMTPAALLAPSAKLAPLPSLEISALPEISPNYKPRPPPRFLPHFTDEDAISAGISSKNQRTKVYSGNKVLGKIPSLYEMCVQILQEHIDALEYTGGVPYEILKPVVDKANPQQLYMLEHFNPYLMEDTDHLWQKFCEKSFRSKKRQELETWREMFMRCQEEQEHRLKSLTANIKIAQEAKKAPIKQTKMAYVDSVVKPPRNVARKQAQHGTAFAASASPAARVAALAAAPNVLKGGRAAPLPAATGTAAFQKPKKAPLMAKALQLMRGRKR